MPVRSASFNPQFNQFRQVAEQAIKTGGAVRVDKAGTFRAEGKNWLGRKVMWLKSHVMPDKTRADNQRVLHAVIRSLEGRGMTRKEIRDTLRGMGGQALQRRGRGDPAAFTRSLERATKQLDIMLNTYGTQSHEEQSNVVAKARPQKSQREGIVSTPPSLPTIAEEPEEA